MLDVIYSSQFKKDYIWIEREHIRIYLKINDRQKIKTTLQFSDKSAII